MPASLSMGVSRQEYWSGLLFPSPEDLPDPGIEPASYASYIGRWVLYHQCHLGSPTTFLGEDKGRKEGQSEAL